MTGKTMPSIQQMGKKENTATQEPIQGDPPLVSVVVLNWNGEAHVHRCIAHAVAQSHKPLEVIVVDNGSRDGSLQKLKAAHRGLIYIENPENRAYAAGMNQGIVAWHAEFVLP